MIPTQPLTVPAELGVDHFAAFPMEWPRRIIAGWSPTGICTVCGEGRRPVMRTEYPPKTAMQENLERILLERGQRRQGKSSANGIPAAEISRTITGYTCACSTDSYDTLRGAPPSGALISEADTTTRVTPAWDDELAAPGSSVLRAGLGNSADGYTPGPATKPAVVLDPFGGTGTTALVASVMGRTGISVDMSADYCRLAEWRVHDPGQRAAAAQVEKPEPVHPDQLTLFTFTDI